MSEYLTPEAIPSRKDIRHSSPVAMDAERHRLLAGGIVGLKDNLRRHNITPDRRIAIHDYALADTTTGRLFNLDLRQNTDGGIDRFETVFYGGYDNAPPIRLSYKPNFSDFDVAYQYTPNVHTRSLLDTFGIIDTNTDLDLSHYRDKAITNEEVWQLAELLRFKASDTPTATQFLEERYHCITLQGTCIEFIAQDINKHTMHYVLDVSTAQNNPTEPSITRALTYNMTVDSTGNTPIATTMHEISSHNNNSITRQDVEQMTKINPELAYLSLNDAIKALHPIE